MISQTTEYALRAVVWLAAYSDRAQTTEEIARGTQVPSGYLSKVLQTLGRADMVRSQRGLGGGFTLVAAPAELTVLDVVNAIDPLRRIRECPLKLIEHQGTLCRLHSELDAAIAMIENAFRSCTIESLYDNKDDTTPLCVVPISRK